MATATLPVGLPLGVSAESGYLDVVQGVRGSSSDSVDWLVPGGEAWLLCGLTAFAAYGGGAGTKQPSLALLNSDFRNMWKDVSNVTMTGGVGSTRILVSYGLGTQLSPTAPVDAAVNNVYEQSLPWLIAPGGYTWEAFIENGQNLGVWSVSGGSGSPLPIASFIRYDVGAGDGSGGGPGGGVPIVTGPYMFVPGPTAV